MTSTVPFVSNGAATNGNGNGYPKTNGSVLDSTVSARIRERLRQEGVSFLANDNISDYLEPGELADLEVEVADKVRDLLRTLVIDIDNDHNTTKQLSVFRGCICMKYSKAVITGSPRSPASPM